ncbi:MAG: hypothetical protein VR72_20865 [Clostridiaceae bacterium BRH_c20a]|nr:MAG: hypothetical protein VR72_20865 [Clostridiaceae bacterium BRH_c20a]
MSDILLILPWGIANLLAEIVFHNQGDLTFYILGFTAIEVMLIICGIYPRINLFRFNKEYINSIVFYIFFNLATNIMFLWVYSSLLV